LGVSAHPFPLLQAIGVALTFLGLLIAIVARYTIGRNWSGSIDIKKGHELITTGIYGYVRHPIYSGVFLMALGAVLVLQSIICLLLLILITIFFVFKYKQEEKFLEKYFPQEYPVYKKRVKAIIPFIL
jgi:protein-S-isoprenylcysteine O-methyltransferase